jgi:hypothetical protein
LNLNGELYYCRASFISGLNVEVDAKSGAKPLMVCADYAGSMPLASYEFSKASAVFLRLERIFRSIRVPAGTEARRVTLISDAKIKDPRGFML